mmetsp:Transcript_10927/g.45447  ORF Transcript_10927/g.45447 Transcript_10927/m.45447 type:complete len:91 (+) Transcript_10927:1615-1887(+)
MSASAGALKIVSNVSAVWRFLQLGPGLCELENYLSVAGRTREVCSTLVSTVPAREQLKSPLAARKKKPRGSFCRRREVGEGLNKKSVLAP